jgi:hypothetical protein
MALSSYSGFIHYSGGVSSLNPSNWNNNAFQPLPMVLIDPAEANYSLTQRLSTAAAFFSQTKSFAEGAQISVLGIVTNIGGISVLAVNP